MKHGSDSGFVPLTEAQIEAHWNKPGGIFPPDDVLCAIAQRECASRVFAVIAPMTLTKANPNRPLGIVTGAKTPKPNQRLWEQRKTCKLKNKRQNETG